MTHRHYVDIRRDDVDAERAKLNVDDRIKSARQMNGRYYVPGKVDSFHQLVKEIEKTREEKLALREWLERGVAEAERVSALLTKLTEEIHQTEQHDEEVQHRVHELTEQCGDIQRALHETNLNVVELQHQIAAQEKTDAEAKTKESMQINVEKSQTPFSDEELNALRKEVEGLRAGAAHMETAESAMDCFLACCRRSLHQVGKLSITVNSGSILNEGGEAGSDNDSFDSEDGAEDTRHPSAVLSTAKALLDRCDSSLCTTWSGLGRIAFDQAYDRRKRDVEFEEACMAIERDLDTTLDDCSAHLEHLREEVHRWTRKYNEIESLVQATKDKDTSGLLESKEATTSCNEEEEDPRSFAGITRRENNALKEENQVLEETNEKLRSKLTVTESDYKAVKELKHAYRDLELKKTELAYLNERLRSDNNVMKLRTWDTDAVLRLSMRGKSVIS